MRHLLTKVAAPQVRGTERGLMLLRLLRNSVFDPIEKIIYSGPLTISMRQPGRKWGAPRCTVGETIKHGS